MKEKTLIKLLQQTLGSHLDFFLKWEKCVVDACADPENVSSGWGSEGYLSLQGGSVANFR